MKDHPQAESMALGTGVSRLMLVSTMLVFGTVGLVIRGISLPTPEIALYRAAIAFVVITLFMLASGRFRALYKQRRMLWRFLLSGGIMAVNWILLFEAIRHTSIALATLAYYSAPALMILGSVLLLKERLSAWQVACFVLSTLGLVMMLGVSSASPGDLKGVLLGLASAVLYATVILINKVSPGLDGISRTWVQFTAAIAVMLPFLALSGGFHLGQLDGAGWASLLLLGILHTGICYCLYFLAIPALKGQQVAIMSYIDPLVAVLLSVFVLGEAISPWQLLGGAVMVVFAVLYELGHRNAGKAAGLDAALPDNPVGTTNE